MLGLEPDLHELDLMVPHKTPGWERLVGEEPHLEKECALPEMMEPVLPYRLSLPQESEPTDELLGLVKLVAQFWNGLPGFYASGEISPPGSQRPAV